MRKIRNNRGGAVAIILTILLLLIIAAVGVVGLYARSCLKPTGDGTVTAVITIEEGQTFDDVLDQLENDHLIKSKDVAKIYAKFNDVSYYAGNYTMNDGMDLDEIFAYLSDPSNAHADAIIVTIPEGKWAKEIADILSHSFNYAPEEFLSAWNDPSYLQTLCNDYEFLNFDDINNDQYRVKLEGYLFPETYSMDVNSSVDTITRTLLNQFNKMYQEYKTDFNKSDLSIHQIVTFASIVQFESGYEQDMPTIASVFYNRLEAGMNMGSSVTVCYALYDDFNDPKDCEIQTDIDSPYNTYLYTGLPIGPILNAGKAAFDAVLHPAQTNYYFFLADIYGDGTVYYSETEDEHYQKQVDLGLVY